MEGREVMEMARGKVSISGGEPGRLSSRTIRRWKVSEYAGLAGVVFLCWLIMRAGYEIATFITYIMEVGR